MRRVLKPPGGLCYGRRIVEGKRLMSLKFRGLLVLLVGTVLGLSLSLGSGVLAQRHAEAPVADELPWDDARLLAEVL
ncbi:MAG: hypothetical protein D6727_02780, partial [Gammaproteobacteria bacterium]